MLTLRERGTSVGWGYNRIRRVTAATRWRRS